MKGAFGCCLTIIIVIALIVGLLVGGVWYVSNMTLGELGLSDYVLFNNMTVDQLGLSDIMIKDIFKVIRSLMAGVDESVIVTHPYTDDDVDNLIDKLQGSSFIDEEGYLTFDNMEGGYAIFDTDTPIKFYDTELAALFDLIMQEGFGGDAPSAEIREVKFTVGTSDVLLRTVLRFDISGLGDNINEVIPPQMQSFINLGNYLYIVTESKISADSEGKITVIGNHSVSINNLPQALTNPFLLVLANAMMEGNEGGNDFFEEGEEIDAGFFAKMVSKIFSEFVYRIGRVGMASDDLGFVGFEAVTGGGGAVTIVPWTLLTVPVEESYIDNVYQEVAKNKALKAYAVTRYFIDNYNSAPDPAINSVNDMLSYISSITALTFISGTEPVADQIVINMSFNGSAFTLNAVYSSVGSYKCTYNDYSMYYLDWIDDYDYPAMTRVQADGMAADAKAEGAYYAAAILAINANTGPLTINNIEEFENAFYSRYGIEISAVLSGGEAPSTSGIVIEMPMIGAAFDYESSVVYVRYSTQTASFLLI